MLDEKFKQIQGTTFRHISKDKKERLLKIFSYKDMESLIVAVGEGEISPREIFKSLFKEKEVFAEGQKPLSKKSPLKDKLETKQVVLAGQSGIQMRLAKCCSPQPGDKIIAYITKNQGATIHKINCKNLKRSQKKSPQKIIEASWKEKKIPYQVYLKIRADDRRELLRDITSVISGMKIKTLSLKSRPREQEKSVSVTVLVEISGLEELDKLFSQLKQVKGITDVKKI